jgi:hypothetical protein
MEGPHPHRRTQFPAAGTPLRIRESTYNRLLPDKDKGWSWARKNANHVCGFQHPVLNGLRQNAAPPAARQ